MKRPLAKECAVMVTAVKTNNRMAKKEATATRPASKADSAKTASLEQGPLKNTIAQIEKQFGEGSIMPLGVAGQAIKKIEGIPTGSLSLDIALGGQGLPKGRVVEIFGPESSGKTTLALHAVAEAQKKGGVCAYIDAEHALDVTYARKLGVKVTELLM